MMRSVNMFILNEYDDDEVYVRICQGSLERRYQTTVGSRIIRTCYCDMLKFIRCA